MRAGQTGAVRLLSIPAAPGIDAAIAAQFSSLETSLGPAALAKYKSTMPYRVPSVVGLFCVAVWLVSTPLAPIPALAPAAFAQNTEAKPADKPAATAQDTAKEPQKIDEYAEAEHAISGPAGNPECVWLGRRVVSLLWRDDLDTAFRHLDLYDRFGCPSGHIQASFRCLLLHASSIDPKAADSLNGRVQACWINPNLQPAAAAATPPPAAAAAPSATTNR